MARFTVKSLRDGIDNINTWLTAAGASVRFECGARDGCQVVDEYNVDDDGNRVDNYVNRTVGSGSSREAYEKAFMAYDGIVYKIELDNDWL